VCRFLCCFVAHLKRRRPLSLASSQDRSVAQPGVELSREYAAVPAELLKGGQANTPFQVAASEGVPSLAHLETPIWFVRTASFGARDRVSSGTRISPTKQCRRLASQPN
jgi:hypothetical protein